MQYLIQTNFMGENISYDLIRGDFNLNCDATCVSSYDNFKALVKDSNELKKKSDFMCITIAVTDACNLKCTYCFEQHGKNFLRKETLSNLCNLIRDYKEKNPHLSRVVIIWFGGEPLLNPEYIIDASTSLKNLCQELSINYNGKIPLFIIGQGFFYLKY